MLQKSIIILFLSFFFANIGLNAQQNECPHFEQVEGLKYIDFLSHHYCTIMKKDNNDNLYFVFTLPVKPGNMAETRTIEFANMQISIEYKAKEQNKLVIVKLDKNLNLVWKNELTLVRDSADAQVSALVEAAIDFDGNGNPYITGNVGARDDTYTLFCNNKKFTIDNNYNDWYNGFLLKLNRANGNAFWLKKINGVRVANMAVSPSDHFYIPFVAKYDTITIDNIQYTGVLKKSGMARYNALGELQWIAWGGTDTKYKFYLQGGSASIANTSKVLDVDNQDNVYTFEFFDSTITKIDSLGQIKWHRAYPDYNSNGHINILIDKMNRLNVIQYLYPNQNIPNPYDFGNGDTVNIAPHGSCFLWQMDPSSGQTTLVSRLWDPVHNYSEIIPLHTTSDINGYLYISGYFWSSDSVRLGDSIYHVTPSLDSNDARMANRGVDAFITKVELPAEGLGNAKFLWTLQSKGTAPEDAQLANTSDDGTEHYIYGRIYYSEAIFGNHHLADTFRDTVSGLIYNKINFYFGKINTDCSLPTEEISNLLQSVNIYPNPAHTDITISNLPLNSTINITDISGRVLYTQYNKSNSTVQIPLNGMGTGMYFVQIINGENRVNKKVVVNR